MLNGETKDSSEEAEMPSTALTYYPVYMHKAHPLDGTWVKLSAKHIEDLAIPPGWEASHPAIDVPDCAPYGTISKFALFHYLNHPLPYIQVCGLVAEVDHKAKPGLLEVILDDSSGHLAIGLMKQWVDSNTIKQENNGGISASDTKVTQKITHCRGWMSGDVFDIQPIQVGSVLRIKGRFSHWGRGKQILVEKYDIFHSTAQEIEYWRGMCREFKNVLSEPWHINEQNMLELTTNFEQDRIAREEHTLRLERRARKKMKEKESRAKDGKARLDDAKLPEPLPRSMPAVLSSDPPCAGLAPSYQVPKKDLASETSSSLDAPPVNIQEHTNLIPGHKSIEFAKPNATNSATRNAEQISSESCNVLNTSDLASSKQYHTFSLSSTEHIIKTSQLGFVDTGAPSQWKQVDLTEEDDPKRTFHGTDWIKLRDKLSSEKSDSIKNPTHQTQEAKRPYSVIEEWNDLVL